ncbi:hypothetical protein B0H13DRAFT_2300576 [Mycena leptocephala]|nr:hypothetical protein B0H13DRAFT_2300576 [Mycena leptocephala]
MAITTCPALSPLVLCPATPSDALPVFLCSLYRLPSGQYYNRSLAFSPIQVADSLQQQYSGGTVSVYGLNGLDSNTYNSYGFESGTSKTYKARFPCCALAGGRLMLGSQRKYLLPNYLTDHVIELLFLALIKPYYLPLRVQPPAVIIPSRIVSCNPNPRLESLRAVHHPTHFVKHGT